MKLLQIWWWRRRRHLPQQGERLEHCPRLITWRYRQIQPDGSVKSVESARGRLAEATQQRSLEEVRVAPGGVGQVGLATGGCGHHSNRSAKPTMRVLPDTDSVHPSPRKPSTQTCGGKVGESGGMGAEVARKSEVIEQETCLFVICKHVRGLLNGAPALASTAGTLELLSEIS